MHASSGILTRDSDVHRVHSDQIFILICLRLKETNGKTSETSAAYTALENRKAFVGRRPQDGNVLAGGSTVLAM